MINLSVFQWTLLALSATAVQCLSLISHGSLFKENHSHTSTLLPQNLGKASFKWAMSWERIRYSIREQQSLTSLRICAVSPQPMLLAQVNGGARRNFSQRTRHGASIRDRVCALKGSKSWNATSCMLTLRKHAYSNILRILPPKMKTFRWKCLVVFIFLLKT